MSRSLALAAALALVTLCAVGRSAAQQTRIVEGVVRSAADTAPLVNVRVRVLEVGSRAETDRHGRFTIGGLPLAAVHLVFERLGLISDTVRVAPDTRAIAVFLRPGAVRVTPLVAEGAPPARERFERLAQTSTVSLDPIDIANTPALLEPDVARVAQLLPGTVAKNDFTVGVNVRGGEADQNLVRLDGITVFNPFHLGGLFGTFDASAVERVDVITGGFPAGFGGRLSSVMDVEVRRGSRSGVNVDGAVSLLAGRAVVDGPIGRSGATYLAGVRRTYADVFTDAFSDKTLGYYFTDAVTKLTLPVGRGRVAVTGYWGRDALDLPWVRAEPGREGVDLVFSWGNRLAGVTWYQPVGAAELEHHLSVSAFASQFGLVPGVLDVESSLWHVALRSGLAVRLTDQNDVRLGLGLETHRIAYTLANAGINTDVPDNITVEDREIPYDFRNAAFNAQTLDLEYRPRVWFAYLDDQWRPVAGVLLRPGVRVEHVSGGADFTGVSPRIGAKVFVTGDLALTASLGRYYQALHSIRDQEVPITVFDYWIGADERTPVARSDHLVVGLERWFGNDVSVSLEAYGKTYGNLPLRNYEDDPKVHGDEFVIATGEAWGIDLLVRRHRGRVRGWVAYGLAKTTRTTAIVPFSPAHDRRHALDVVVQAPGPFGSALSVHWGYGSGLPYSGIVGQWPHRKYNAELHLFELAENEVISTERNGERFPHYSRLDVGLRWRVEALGGIWRPYVSVLNLYDRRNVFFYAYDFGETPPTRSGWSQLPMLPTVGVEFSW
ncbi:MAG: TonB-dependent receptor [Gemmatimonadales bacterium]|jgi:hypothetical protein